MIWAKRNFVAIIGHCCRASSLENKFANVVDSNLLAFWQCMTKTGFIIIKLLKCQIEVWLSNWAFRFAIMTRWWIFEYINWQKSDSKIITRGFKNGHLSENEHFSRELIWTDFKTDYDDHHFNFCDTDRPKNYLLWRVWRLVYFSVEL